MASLTHDGQSFTINGRRRWLVGASIDFSRLTRDQWPDRLRAARQAGFNTISVRVCWAQHERSPGEFDFTGDLDIREFIRAIGRERLFAVLRPGPFINAGWDAGGLPGWLIDGRPEVVRTGDSTYKEAVARWFSALFDQIKSLQLTSAGAGGPIILIQNEHAWFRGDADSADASIGETARFLRESGARVPIINANNLFASAEGELDTWLGNDHLFTTLRQLRAVRPDAPPMALDVPLADQPAWGESPGAPDAASIVRTLAESLAAGGQFMVDPLCAGLTPGFLAGRDGRNEQRYFTSIATPAAPISIAGGRTANYAAIKRIATFASSFERVLANLDFEAMPIAQLPGATGGSVIPLAGSQGSLVVVTASDMDRDDVALSLPDGREFSVPLGKPPVALLLFDTLMGRRATLDYCNLSAFANVGDVFVCYGAAGSSAQLSVSGVALEATVPGGKLPVLIEHEDLTVVICSEDQVDATIANDEAVFVGCAGLDASGAPIPDGAHATCLRIGADRTVEKISMARETVKRRRPALSAWRAARDGALSTETADGGWTAVNEPQANARLGSSLGYLWLRCDLRLGKARRTTLGFLETQDRAHVFLDGERLGVVGRALDAHERTIPLSLAKGEHALTILVDHLGRPSGGAGMGQTIGLPDNLWEVKAFRLNKPKLVTAAPLAPVTAIAGRVWDLHSDEMTDPRRLQWSFTYRRLAPLSLQFATLPAPALVILNDEPIAWLAPGGPDVVRLPDEPLRRGGNVLELAVMGDAERALDDFAKAVSAYEGKEPLTKDPSWSWAPWRAPEDDHFESVAKSAMKSFSNAPTWWRATFFHTSSEAPLSFDARGLSKGQLCVNGRNVGRYVAAVNGRKLSTILPIPIPGAWLRDDQPNEITIFDEFGAAPDKCRLVWTD